MIIGSVAVTGAGGATEIGRSGSQLIGVRSVMGAASFGWRLRSRRLTAAASRATTAAMSRLVRSPGRRSSWSASSAPKTATASAPPIWRLVLNTPLAVPAWWSGTLLSSTAVTGGMISGPPRPTSTISTASTHTGVEDGSQAEHARPGRHQHQAGGDQRRGRRSARRGGR